MSTNTATAAPATPRKDPTQTTTIRKSLNQTLSGRVRDARGDVRQQVEGQNQQPGTATGTGTGTATTTTAAGVAGIAAAGVGGLAFLRSLTAVRQWLSGVLTGHVLDASPQQARRGQTYLSGPLHSAYETGLRQARAALRAQGYDIGERGYEAAIADARHQRALARLYERAYVDIEDALANTTQEVSRTIADGGYIDADAVNKRDLADVVNERLRANYGKRLDPLADTLAVRAANQAALAEYATAGAERVGVEAEAADAPREADWQTANDGNVCPECHALAAGAPYRLADIFDGNPAPPPSPHPRCRCFLFPLPS